MDSIFDKDFFASKTFAHCLKLDYKDVMSIYKSGRNFISIFLSSSPELKAVAETSLEDFLLSHTHLFSKDQMDLFNQLLSSSGAFGDDGWITRAIQITKSKSEDKSNEAILNRISRSLFDPDVQGDEEYMSQLRVLTTYATVLLIDTPVYPPKTKDRPEVLFDSVLRELIGYRSKFGEKASKVISESLFDYCTILEMTAQQYGPWFLPSTEDLRRAKKTLNRHFPDVTQVDTSGSCFDVG